MSTSKSPDDAKFPSGTQDFAAIRKCVGGLAVLITGILARFVVAAKSHDTDGLLEEARRLRAIATRLDAYRRLLLREWANEEKTIRENSTRNHTK